MDVSAAAVDRSPARRVRILGAGGTIAMSGAGGATPELDAAALVAAVVGLAGREGLEARTVLNLPSAHLTLAHQLELCHAARDAARRGIGVVVTHGTDVLEETAMLCDVITTPRRRSPSPGRSVRPARRAPTGPRTSSTRWLWAEAAERIPVLAYCRPERGVVLRGTYGYAAPSRTCATPGSSRWASSRRRPRG